ncbi:MAG: hypothetical protein IKA33_02535, partial [Candidatus Methanomethylophilaceae archaeon]|nr:hypothetical protein [Candidatus Methanomethylophilaceae archaeon]
VTVNAHAGNRGIYGINTVTINSDAEVNAAGYEKGVRTDKALTVNGILDAEVCNVDKGTNLSGDDDRQGIKSSGLITITGEVSTESINALAGITINGTGILDVEYDADAGRLADVEKGITAIPLGLNVTGDVSIGDSAKLIVCESNLINATIKNTEANEVVFENVEATSDVTITVGSIVINGAVGSYSEDEETGSITVTGNVEISGQADVPIIVTGASTITVPLGETLVLNKDMTVGSTTEGAEVTVVVLGEVIGDKKIVPVSGNKAEIVIEAEDTDAVKNAIDSTLVENIVATEAEPVTGSGEGGEILPEDIEAALEKFNKVSIEGEVQVTGDDSLTIGEGKTLELVDGASIIVGNNTIAGEASLTINGNVRGDGYILVYGYLEIVEADVRVPVIQCTDDAYIYVKALKPMTVSGQSTGDLGVGYGNTLIVEDLTISKDKKVQAWGTVIVKGTVTVDIGASFEVYAGGNAQVEGNLIVKGKTVVEGDMTVTGSVKVENTDGNAQFITKESSFETISTVAGKDTEDVEPEVVIEGTMDVKAPKIQGAAANILDAQGGITVIGTLSIDGTFNGTIFDKGTVNFSGHTGNDATITVFDGVTLNIASVDGELTVNDEDIVDEESLSKLNYAISASNEVVLYMVKGVTISVAVDETIKDTKVGTDEVKVRYYVSTMTITGDVKDINSKATSSVNSGSKITIGNEDSVVGDIELNGMTGNPTAEKWTGSKSKVSIGDLDLGKYVTLEIDGANIDVDGTVNVIAEGATIGTEANSKAVDINGMIVKGNDGIVDGTLNVNGAYYKIESEDEANEYTDYYTTFAAALAATGIDEDLIQVYGKVKVKTEMEIPAGIEVEMMTGSEMEITVDGVLTVASTALFEATNAKKIDVKGMLVIADKHTGLNEPSGEFKYQVKTETETSETYSGLILALRNAQSGQTIEIDGAAEIDESVTIPEGVTLLVPQKATLTVGDDEDKVVLTVKGTLKVTQGTIAIKAYSETEVVVDGVVAINGLSENNTNYTNVKEVSDDFVMFEMKVDGKYVTVMSNIAYAAENAVEGEVTVFGDVSGGDVTFTEKEKPLEDLVIVVDDGATLSVSSMTLVGATLEVGSTAVIGKVPYFSGAVKATAADGVSEIEAVKACNFTIASGIEEDVDGKTDVMYVAGIPQGEFTLASGTINVGKMTFVIGQNNNFTGLFASEIKEEKTSVSVADGVTLVVPDDVSFMTNAFVDENVVIAGDIIVKEGANVRLFGAIVSGQVTVESGANVVVGTADQTDSSTVVTGTISAAA